MRCAAGIALLLAATGPAHALDAAQARWLAQHGPVRFAPERDFGPFIFADAQGQVRGISIDLLEEIGRDTGLALSTLPPQPLAQVLQSVRERRADLAAALRPTPERAAYLRFTRPYVNVPAVLVVRRGASKARSLSELGGQAVAVGAGYAVEAVVRERHAAVKWQAVSDDAVALHGVAEGRYAAAVCDSASLAFVARRDGLDALVAVSRVGFDYSLSFAVRSDWPELQQILDQGLVQLPAARRQELVERWLAPVELDEPARAPVATFVAAALLAVAGVLAVRGAWRRKGRA